MGIRGRGPRSAAVLGVVLASLLLSSCQSSTAPPATSERSATEDDEPAGATPSEAAEEPSAPITLAFAGDVHFEGSLAGLPGRPRSTLGPMSQALRTADVAMVNLESALTGRGAPTSKELEDSFNRYWFRSPESALDVMRRSGVDVVSVANNHGGDYGAVGVRDAARAGRQSPVAVVGVGRDHREAFAPYRTNVKGTDVAVFAADASPRESDDDLWAVGPGTGPGIASARVPSAPQLVAAVRRSAQTDDVTVVYVHWGEENNGCPTGQQQALARNLTAAGADIIVGSHAHVLLGSGLLETGGASAYVNYGLGNFLWYHGRTPESGVLRLTVRDGEVVGDDWRPAEIPLAGGQPQPLTRGARADAINDWEGARGCTDLAPGPSATGGSAGDGEGDDLPPYVARVREIGPALRRQMIGSSHEPGACPVGLGDLRHLTMTYVGFDGAAHEGQMVVAADVAGEVTRVFAALYESRFPIRRMRLIDAYDGNDNRSMAANNTSGYNCRRVAGTSTFSNHALGRAIDINPVQNPYVRSDGSVLPAAGRRFVSVDRGPRARVQPGVITQGDAVRRAFGRIDWSWGGDFSAPDFQHFSTS